MIHRCLTSIGAKVQGEETRCAEAVLSTVAAAQNQSEQAP